MPFLTNDPSAPQTCTKTDCILNWYGINHNIGIYKHEDKTYDQSNTALFFENCNPPPFVWVALAEWKAGDDAIKQAGKNGGDVEKAKGDKETARKVVSNFLLTHGGITLDDARSKLKAHFGSYP